MATTCFTYHFEGKGVEPQVFEVTVERSMTPRKGRAAWTELHHCQCEHCPLHVEAFSHCPAAVDIEVVLEAFNDLLAVDEIRTIVSMPNGRELCWVGETRTALAALLGLIMASSPCPILSRLKGLAKTHVPFQTPNEVVFRFISAYLLGQFVEQRRGAQPDWTIQGLKRFLTDLELLNRCFMRRLEVGSRQDRALAVIRVLLGQAMGTGRMLDSWAEEMQEYGMPAVEGA